MTVVAVGVVIPACDEELLLPDCLDALEVAVRQVAVPVRVVVVLDRCVDASAELVADRRWVAAVTSAAGNVGMARGLGCADVLRYFRDVSPSALWLATTDADTLVPPDWIAHQLELAVAGWEVVVGTVTVADWTGHPPEVAPRFRAQYFAVEDHDHVHGANLGCTASAYLDVGGWQPLSLDEDVALLAGLSNHRVLRTARNPVVTSARRDPRASGGFGDTLRELAG
jgi:hypothetical protein